MAIPGKEPAAMTRSPSIPAPNRALPGPRAARYASRIAAALALALGACSAGPATDTADRAAQRACAAPVALQVLGSGGPLADDDRAGSAYLLRINGKGRLLIDAGGGAFLRFAEAKATLTDLDAIAISHLHADHAGDLAAILNSGSFEGRTAPLPLYGPAGGDIFPGMAAHLAALIGPRGAFPYLAGYLDGSNGYPRLEVREIDPGRPGEQMLLDRDGIRLSAIGVRHLDIPALGFVIRTDGKTVVLAGDQSFLSEDFAATLQDMQPDLMVIHNAIPEAEGQPRGLHRLPSEWGALAATIRPRRLVLSHNMQRALVHQDAVLTTIAKAYKGPVYTAADLDCFALD